MARREPKARTKSINAIKAIGSVGLVMGILAAGVRRSSASVIEYNVTDLGTIGGTISYAYGISNNGQVTGAGTPSGNQDFHAFRYSSGIMTDLGTLDGSRSWGNAINNSGQVTGYSYVTSYTDSHAFLYSNGVIS